MYASPAHGVHDERPITGYRLHYRRCLQPFINHSARHDTRIDRAVQAQPIVVTGTYTAPCTFRLATTTTAIAAFKCRQPHLTARLIPIPTPSTTLSTLLTLTTLPLTVRRCSLIVRSAVLSSISERCSRVAGEE